MNRPVKELYDVLKRLEERGYEAYLVGGAVRDMVLGAPIKDYDITTNADPNAIRMAFQDHKTYDLGKKHGTVTVLAGTTKFEITPFRLEDDYRDHRHPETVLFTSDLKDDLKRRDFTINALCMDSNDQIIDLFDGIRDIENRQIRAIGDPKARFNEDALRILRALRFEAALDFEIEAETKKQIEECAYLLECISAERKKEELLKILCCQSAFRVINENLRVFQAFMPFHRITRTRNNFSSPFYALAYLLRNEKDPDLRSLKYSNQEIRLIEELIRSSKIDISDDTHFIECLSSLDQKDILRFLNQYHRKDFNDRFEKLRPWICTLNELKIDGKTIRKYGYREKQISQIKQKLLDQVHQRKVNNTAEGLESCLAKNPSLLS